MKKLLAFLAFALCPFAVQAQTPGGQPEICVTSPSQTANYNQLCISASSTGGKISVLNLGSATGGLSMGSGTTNTSIGNGGNVIIGSATLTPDAPLEVTVNTAASPGTLPVGTIYHVVGATTVTGVYDAFGSNAAIVGRRADGTAASPTAVQANEAIYSINGRGYGATGYAAGGRGTYLISAAENWSDTSQGTYLSMLTTPTGGSTTQSEILRIGNAATQPYAAFAVGSFLGFTGSTAPTASTYALFGDALHTYLNVPTSGLIEFNVNNVPVADYNSTNAGSWTFTSPQFFTGLPTSAGGGGLYVCVDSVGKLYKKSACP